MTFHLPDSLAPEVYPLAWLVGTWRGPGFLGYPDIPERPILSEVTFASDGGPYLAYTATTWLLEGSLGSLDGELDVASLVPGAVWSVESGYWRVTPTVPDDASAIAGAADAGGPDAGGPDAAVRTSAGAPAPGPTELEVLVADPSGHISVYLGAVQGPRVDLATDLIARTATGAEVTAASRMYGLVGGELIWAADLAAFGHELQAYSSGRLQRQE